MKLHGNHSVYSLAFSSDGRLLASGGGDGVIVLVDMETLKPLTKPEQSFTRGITSVNFSPRKDQLLLAAGSFDDTVGIFNVLVQQPLSSDLVTLEGNIVGISPGEENETWIAFSDEEGSEIHHLNISTDELVTKMDFPLKHAVFNPDHTLLAVKTVDDLIFTIELPSGRLVHEFKDFVANSQLAFSQDGNLLVISGCKYIFIGGDSGRQCEGLRISFLDPVSGEPLQPSFDLGDVLIPLTGDYILSMAISPDKSTLAIGNQSKSIFLIDVANGEQVNQPLQGHTSGVVALAFSPDRITLASADEDNMIMLWDMEYNLPIADPVRSPIGSIRTMAFSRDGLTLYLGSEDGRVIAWNANGKSWMEMNCSQAGRILTIEEWRQFLSDKKYQPFCTGAE